MIINRQDYQAALQLRADNERQAAELTVNPNEDVSEEQALIPAKDHQIPVIIYRPIKPILDKLPVMISIHGGGFIMAHAWMDGPFCREICRNTGCMVINIEYRLAPEFPYPAALDDCYAVTEWIFENGAQYGADIKHVVIGGYSAGANLSTAVCLKLRDQHQSGICGQILCYPPLNLTDENRDAEDKTLSSDISHLFNVMYLQDRGDVNSAYVSPLLAEDLSGLPRVILFTGGKDALNRDSIAYAQKLRKAGVPTELLVYPDANHGFTHEIGNQDAEDAWKKMYAFLSDCFHQ